MSSKNDSKTKDVSKWLEVRISAPGQALEALAHFFSESGLGGSIFSEDPKKRPGLEIITAFFPVDRETPAKLEALRAHVDRVRIEFPEPEWGQIETWTIESEDWLSSWKDNFQALALTPQLWVVPTWLEVPEQARDALVIRIDPGMAFGTGLHATTRMCAGALEQFIPQQASSVLDLGTGTGILAMAAALLGATRVLGVDLDPEAVKVARENLEANGLKNKVELKVAGADPDALLDPEPFELIVANLFSEELIRVREMITRHLSKTGVLILCGILQDKAEQVISAYAEIGFPVRDRLEDGEWVSLILTRS